MPPLRATAEERRNLLAYLGGLSGTPAGPLESETPSISADAIRAITTPKQGEWPTYNGVPGGNRYSKLDQIDTHNVHSLQPQWVYSLPGVGLQTTPIVSEGVMYVTAPEEICALDSGTGKEIWGHAYKTGAGKEATGSGVPNRGVALLDDRLFFATSDAHLICLHRLTGGVMWDVKMPSTPGQFSATGAPLVVGDLVISGVAGGDGPLRGFLAAYRAT